MAQERPAKSLLALAASMSVLAGMLHFWLAPIHWLHAPAHGAFFFLIGVVQVVWGSLVWRQPSNRLYYIGAILSGSLIVLYAITRWLPAPFGHGPEGVDALGLTCKLCEALSMIPLMMLILQGLMLTDGRKVARQTAALIILFSVVAGVSTYLVALAAEPYFPALSAPAADHHHDDGAGMPQHEH